MKRLGTVLTGVALIVTGGVFAAARAETAEKALLSSHPRYTQQDFTVTLSTSAANCC
jgi:hypothetical protein